MLRILVSLLVLGGTARAGVCLSDQEADDDMKLVEGVAKDRSKLDEARSNYAFLCVEGAAKRLRARIEKACVKILDRDGESEECMRVAAAAGFATLGKHDVFAWVTKHVTEDPTENPGGVGAGRIELLAASDPARALPVVLDDWKAAIPRADAREKRHREMASWSGWRQRAAKVLGEIGGKDEIAFLDEQAKATKDKHVAEACRDAIKAIEKRTAAAAPAKPAAASPIGVWRGSSTCTVKPSACHDETVVYHVSAGTDPDSFVFDANKLVDGREEEMGTVACHLERDRHALVCPIPKGTFTYVVDGDHMRGTLDLPDGTRFRRIDVERAR